MTTITLKKPIDSLGLVARGSLNAVNLTWSPVVGLSHRPSYDGSVADTPMDVYRAFFPEGPWTLLGSSREYSYVDKGLSVGTTYYYRIAPQGTTIYSTVVSASPGATAATIPAGSVSAVKLGNDVAVLNGGGTQVAYNYQYQSGSGSGAYGIGRGFIGVVGSGGASYSVGSVSSSQNEIAAGSWQDAMWINDMRFSVQAGVNFELNLSGRWTGKPSTSAALWARVGLFQSPSSSFPLSEWQWKLFEHDGTDITLAGPHVSFNMRSADELGWFIPANAPRTLKVQFFKQYSGTATSWRCYPHLVNLNYHFTI